MSAPAWLLLALAALLVPSPGVSAGRVAALATAGRLEVGPAARTGNRRALPGKALAGLGAAATALAVWLCSGPILGCAAAVVAGVGWLLVRDAAARSAQQARQRDLRVALRVLVGELEAGARPPAALDAAGAAAPRYADVFDAAAAAASTSADAGSVLLTEPATRPIGLAWQVAAETGTALAGVLDRVAEDLRFEQERRRAVDVGLAGPRASALLLSALPLVGVALGAGLGARPVAVLAGTRTGQLLCLVGVLLDAAGLLWMRRLVRRAALP